MRPRLLGRSRALSFDGTGQAAAYTQSWIVFDCVVPPQGQLTWRLKAYGLGQLQAADGPAGHVDSDGVTAKGDIADERFSLITAMSRRANGYKYLVCGVVRVFDPVQATLDLPH